MNVLNVKSEIGKLKKVLLHRPGNELENLTPKWLDQLLFDDIPWLHLAQQEHDRLADIFRAHGVEVLYLVDLVTESLEQNDDIKQQFIKQFICEANIHSEEMLNTLIEYLNSFDTKAMVEKTMAGIRKSELPNYVRNSLEDYIRDYPFATDPMPNLYFTRDPFNIIGNGIAINKMFTTTRGRETIYGEYIFKYHPVYGSIQPSVYYERTDLANIEGGDILVLNEKTLAIGVSQRTHPAGVEALAKRLFFEYNTTFEKIVAFDIPKTRAFMHLDTIFTQVDYDKFLIHNDMSSKINAYELAKNGDKLSIKPVEKKLQSILEYYLGHKVTLIRCGGDNVITSDREQWSDGANSIAIAPGEVIVYQRNHITNQILMDHGIKVYAIPSSELSRGRGGPRCMSLPFYRDDLINRK